MAGLTPRFGIGVLNAWLLCLPILGVGLYLAVARREVVRRMADMTGYTPKEKAFTVAASVAPYPFIALTVWVPFVQHAGWLAAGLSLYALGVAAYLAAAVTFTRNTGRSLIDTGVYRYSRNPLYVSAAFMFLGISIATANVVLLGIELVGLVLQHFMILAEERSCRARFGGSYDEYIGRVPRYLMGL